MTTYTVGFVGAGDPEVGRNPELAGKEGFAVAYRQAPCYQELDDTELVACADLVPENADAFAEEFDVPTTNVYEDYREMLAEVDIDIVNVSTPAPTHADIVVDCAETDALQAIHCQKPIARTWGECRRMAEVCEKRGIQLTFNHELRFGTPWRRAKDLLEEGAIGDLQRIEVGAGPLYSMGTHALDHCGLLNDEHAAEWVLGQIDCREENVFSSGAHNENQAIAIWKYENGVSGLAATGQGTDLVNAFHRLIGTAGEMEVAPFDDEADLRVRRMDSAGWEIVDCGDGGVGGLRNGYPYMIDAISEVVAALDEDRPSELGAHNALKSTEIIFATYESARRRGRVDLPLTIDDNPLEAMVESGGLSPGPSAEE